MTKLITTFLIFFGCHNKNSGQTFLPLDKNDIHEIVEAVVNQDSLPSVKTDGIDPIPFSLDLRKIQVTVPDTTTDVPPPIDHNTVSIFNLFH